MMRFIPIILLFTSCSVSKNIENKAKQLLLSDTGISKGHIGISIYDAAEKKYLYNHNADKYFIPASNTKIFTLYAGLKYLEDSLTGLEYVETDSSVRIKGTGDPSFLHADFKTHPVLTFLQNTNKKIEVVNNDPAFLPYGKGWSWDDYNEKYMAERSDFPMYGNVISILKEDDKIRTIPSTNFIGLHSIDTTDGAKFILERKKDDNQIYSYSSGNVFEKTTIPFANMASIQTDLLAEALQKPVTTILASDISFPSNPKIIKSQPTDSVLRKMMVRSDNLYAEQLLLMAGNKKLGYLCDGNMIDKLLETDLNDIPQQPKWVDGSGLSRYNLFTPQSMVYIIEKMKNEFGIERIKTLFPTGGQGTLSNYYLADSSFVFAKTGSLGNVTTLSGFLFTKKSKLLIFSVLINHYRTTATSVRRAVEGFVGWVRETY